MYFAFKPFAPMICGDCWSFSHRVMEKYARNIGASVTCLSWLESRGTAPKIERKLGLHIVSVGGRTLQELVEEKKSGKKSKGA